MRINLRTKMMLFAAVIAALPLLVAGQSLIRVAQDELKSAANEQLAVTARQISDEFNAFFEYSQFTPLDLIRNAIGGNKLDLDAKITLLRQGIADLPDVVTLQVEVDGAPKPFIVAQETYVTALREHIDDPFSILRVEGEDILAENPNPRVASNVLFVPENGDWLATASLPITEGIGGKKAALYARINLKRLSKYVQNHPFTGTGTIQIVDAKRNIVFSSTGGTYTHTSVLDTAMDMLETGNATIAIEPFELENKSISLGAIALSRAFPRAILVEKSEADAYQTVSDMVESLVWWLSGGLIAALIGAFVFALGISRPILKIGQSALEIAKGNLDTRVEGVHSKDEIGQLATQFNDMIVQLNERFELQKFVSVGTMKAIQENDERVVSLGGERRRTAMLFADIRGYTAFSENRPPEEVVEVLNIYFQELSDIVIACNGDIDKFVGDQIMAVFSGPDMEEDATDCALQIMSAIDEMAEDSTANLRIGIGLDVGDVVVGAMGSDHRKDFTVLGDHVNTAARLCSAAEPDETLITLNIYYELPKELRNEAKELKPLALKGKAQKLRVYAFSSRSSAVDEQ
ncbi:MAG: HAMP domain-containing protein [Rhizobiales bacterium]|nr:HAMP domain-containing protein [Hyphomicrobiales bacterium]